MRRRIQLRPFPSSRSHSCELGSEILSPLSSTLIHWSQIWCSDLYLDLWYDIPSVLSPSQMLTSQISAWALISWGPLDDVVFSLDDLFYLMYMPVAAAAAKFDPNISWALFAASLFSFYHIPSFFMCTEEYSGRVYSCKKISVVWNRRKWLGAPATSASSSLLPPQLSSTFKYGNLLGISFCISAPCPIEVSRW